MIDILKYFLFSFPIRPFLALRFTGLLGFYFGHIYWSNFLRSLLEIYKPTKKKYFSVLRGVSSIKSPILFR